MCKCKKGPTDRLLSDHPYTARLTSTLYTPLLMTVPHILALVTTEYLFFVEWKFKDSLLTLVWEPALGHLKNERISSSGYSDDA